MTPSAQKQCQKRNQLTNFFLSEVTRASWRDHNSSEVWTSNRMRENLNLFSQNHCCETSAIFNIAPCRRCIFIKLKSPNFHLGSPSTESTDSIAACPCPKSSSGLCVMDVLFPNISGAGLSAYAKINTWPPKRTPNYDSDNSSLKCERNVFSLINKTI